MQLQFRTRVIAALAVITMLASCSKTNKQGRMIPKDAVFVVHINSKSLSEKIDMAEMKQTDWYKQVVAEMKSDTTAPDFIKKLQNNTQNTGIDTLSDYIIFGETKMGESMKFVLEGGIRDSKAFESFLKNMYPEGISSKEGDISIMPVMGKAVVTWNTEKFAACIQVPVMNGYNLQTDTTKNVETILQLEGYAKKLYALKDEENLSKDEKFSGLMNTDGDIHFWMNTGKLMNSSPQLGMLSMLKMDKLLDGNISTLTLNFDKGKITVKSKGYAGKELSDIMSKYSGGSINTDMIKNIPSQNIVGVFAFHFKPEGLKELVKLSGLDGFLDLMLMQKGFSTDDFVKANKGDIMFAVSDLTVKKDSITYKDFDGKMQTSVSENPDAKVVFSAAIDDKDAFNKLINAAKEASGTNNNQKITYNSNGTYFAIGNSPDMIKNYLAGGSKNEAPFLSKISGNAIGAYLDLQKILKAFESDASKDSIGKLMWDESVKIWDNATLTGGDYSGGGYNQMIEVNLVDKNTNSLKQLFKYGMTMSNLGKEKRKNWNTDTTVSDTRMEEIKKNNQVPPPVPPPPAKPKKK